MLLKVKEAKKEAKLGVDEMLQCGASKRWEFLRDDVMRVVAEFVVCDNQVSVSIVGMRGLTDLHVWKSLAVANKPAFRNCLVAMCPNANKADITSSHDISTFIHNSFVNFLQNLKHRIQVSLFICLKSMV